MFMPELLACSNIWSLTVFHLHQRFLASVGSNKGETFSSGLVMIQKLWWRYVPPSFFRAHMVWFQHLIGVHYCPGRFCACWYHKGPQRISWFLLYRPKVRFNWRWLGYPWCHPQAISPLSHHLQGCRCPARRFSLPRQHALVHYCQHIRNFGAPNGLCSSLTESKHISAVKKSWWRSNWFNALQQMLIINTCNDKLAAARVDFVLR